ncbi:MAG: 3-phosphoshikimate 1-carboxyvinyltransferase [Anaerolineales bacterium]|jgi:3-phosphoshikimate 1-carboxyvinyltransferase
MIRTNPGKPLQGSLGDQRDFNIPGDKSISHRAALFSALAVGESEISNFLIANVTKAMLDGLQELGFKWEFSGTTLKLAGKGIVNLPTTSGDLSSTIDCGNSATTMRLLAGALPGMGKSAVLDGSSGLRKRPMTRIVKPLKKMGVPVQDTGGCAPLIIGKPKYPLKPLNYTLPVASAQVKTCILLAALAAEGETTVYEPGPSRDHSERMLKTMGVEIYKEPRDDKRDIPVPSRDYFVTRILPPGNKRLTPLKMTIPGDISSGAFIIVAGLICPDSEIKIEGLGINPTRIGILDALLKMGADISIQNQQVLNDEPVADLVVRSSKLRGVELSGSEIVRMIDEFPIFAVAASYADGITRVKDAEELRYKESDRIAAISSELSKIGVRIEEKPDGFTIYGGYSIEGGDVDSHGDHRLAMSLAVAGLSSKEGTRVKSAEVIAESFPDFINILKFLGADVQNN